MLGCDNVPSPSTLDANTVTLMSVEDEHSDDNISNTCPHTPSSQEDTGIIVEPQTLPDEASR